MRLTPLAYVRRRALAGFGLALFLIGINWCLVGAMVPSAGMGMPCMPVAAAGGADAGPAAHAGHCAGMARNAGEESAAPAPAPPCCIALTPVLAPEAAKTVQPLVAVLDLPLDPPAVHSAPQTTGELLRAPPQSPPPLAALRAPCSPRAPPTI